MLRTKTPKTANAAAVARPALDRSTWIILAIFLALGAVAAYVTFSYVRDFFAKTEIFNVGDLPAIVSAANPDPSVTGDPSDPTKAPTLAPVADVGPTPVPWNGSDRVTVLLMGLDYRDWEAGEDIPRTDTMILLTIDPVAKTAGIISIPRDMWVNIPGFGYSRINAAYRTGEMYKVPGGGKALAMKTVENFLGVPVNDCALIDFMSFVRFIDELGGLDMHIREEIKVDPIGQGNTIVLKPGVQALDGATVLAYARMRYTKDGDFDRSKRQQEVIMAIRDQVLQFNQMPVLVSKAPQLYQELSSGIKTTLTLDRVIPLAWLASQIKEENIKKGVFDPHKDVNYASVMSSEGKADILVPNPERIRLLRDEVFGIGTAAAPAGESLGSSEELMKIEKPRIVLLNGSQTPGTAERAAELLRAAGAEIVSEQPASTVIAQTTIKDHTGKPYTIKYLMEKYGLKDIRVVNDFDPNAQVDLEITIGNDWVNP